MLAIAPPAPDPAPKAAPKETEADPFRVMVPAHSHFARSINCCKGAPCPGRNGESTFGPNQDAIGN